MRLIRELQRRRVFRSIAAYALAALAAIEGADILVPRMNLPDWVVGAVVLIAFLGLPFVIALSWTYDWSWGQLVRDRGDTAHDAVEPVGTRVPDGYRTRSLSPNSVAVLPFASLGPEGKTDYFSDGVTEEITAALCSVPDLRVISRTSVAELQKRGGGGIGEIGRRLGVAVVVEGSVRRHGGRVRIVAQATDVETETGLWTDTFDRKMEDIFAIQSGVARRVAEAMAAYVSPGLEQGHRRQRTADPEAYDLYLRALHLWNQRAEGAFEQSIGMLEEALRRDPGFALAHAGLAMTYMTMSIYGLVDPETAETRVGASVGRALATGTKPPEALVARGCARAMFRWEWDEAEADLRAAIDENRSYATAHQWLAVNVLAPLRRFEEAEAALEEARRVDPISPSVAVSSGVLAYFQGDTRRALRHYDDVLRLHPDFASVHFFRGQALAAAGDLALAIRAIETAIDRTGGTSEMLAALGYVQALAGHTAEARERLRVLESSDRWVSPVLTAQIHAALGAADTALTALHSAAAARAPDLVWIGVRPIFGGLREDARFSELLSEIGLPIP